MSIHPSDTETLGIDKDGSFLRAAYLIQKKGIPHLEKLYVIKIPAVQANGESSNPLYNTDEGKQIKSLLDSKLSLCTMPTNKILTRRLIIKLVKDKDVEAAFPFQAEPLLPFPIQDAVLDKITVSKADGTTTLTLQAVKRDHLKEALEHWNQWDIHPETISSVPSALAAFVNTFTVPGITVFAIHIGCTHTTCALIKEGKLISAYGNDFGTDYLLEAYAIDLKQPSETLRTAFTALDFAQIDHQTLPELSEAIQKLGQEISRMVFGMKKETKLKDEFRLVSTGEGGALRNLPSVLLNGLEIPVILPEPTEDIQTSVEDLQRFAIPLGLALSGFPKYQDQINFRQDEFAYPTPWKRFTKPLAIYACVCLMFAFAFYIFGQTYLSYRLDQAKSEYMNMLTLLHKPYQSFEAEYEAKNKIVRPNDEEGVLPIESFNKEDLQHRIGFLEKQIQAMPDTYSLYPNVPLVSDVLAWLSNHPTVVCAQGDAEGGNPNTCNALQIESFTYTLVKRPEQTKKTEKYQVKVDLEFTAPTPKMAREFHDALIAPNDMVDPKAEVKWSSNRGKYRASFYLKDKPLIPATFKREPS